MKTTLIKLNNDTGFDLLTLIETRLAILANSGGGKSWAVRRLIDWAFGKVQIIIIDPEGEYGNLREKYDFILAGRDADAVVETRSAALLATRLLETEASAIVDLYDLVPQDRKHFVRLFIDSIMNAPKELYHDVLIIVDEAHVFAPEKEQSEALGSLISLASQGRKRGFCGVFATQRIAKMSKDVLAECNNKMIGRMTLDVDRKRAAEELGLTTKDDIRNLRNMLPGEFFVFGPAISSDVIKVQVGPIKVLPPKRGASRTFKAPPPSAKVKAILAELKDLPEAAQKEAKTVKELKEALTLAKRQISTFERGAKSQSPDPDAIKKLTDKAFSLGFSAAETKLKPQVADFRKRLEQVYKISSIVGIEISGIPVEPPKLELPYERFEKHVFYETPKKDKLYLDEDTPGKGEMKVLAALAQYPDGMTRDHITVATGYKRSTRDAYIARLMARGYVSVSMGSILATDVGKEALGDDYVPLPTGRALIDHYLRTLPGGEAKVFEFLVDHGDETRDAVSAATGFKRSTRDAYLARLTSRKLVVPTDSGMVGVNRTLL